MKQLLIVLTAASAALAQQATAPPAPHPPRPGTINYVEGDVTIGARPIGPDAIGTVELAANQMLTTRMGKAEVLLTRASFSVSPTRARSR